MPFMNSAARSFSAVSIYENAPDASGVYGLSNEREWLFVGEANDIQTQLLGHLKEINTVLIKQQPTGFMFEVCSVGDRFARQDSLVQELEPRCNRRVG